LQHTVRVDDGGRARARIPLIAIDPAAAMWTVLAGAAARHAIGTAPGETRVSAHAAPRAAWRRRLLIFGLLGSTAAIGCDSPAAPARVASVAVTPAVSSVIAGATLPLSAAARDAAGSAIAGRAITWSSGNVSVATVSTAGLVAGLAPGSVVVSATSDGQAGSATITVLPIPVASLVITPGTATLVAGTTRQFTATARDAVGNALTGRLIEWSVNTVSAATIDANGLLTAVAPGTAVVTAASEGRSIMATVSVLPIPVATVVVTPATLSLPTGLTRALTVSTRDANGTVLTGRFVSWRSDAATVATVDAVGVVTAVSTGATVISATSEGQSGAVTITVTPGAGGPTITSTTPASLLPGTTLLINGAGFDNTLFGNVVTIGGVTAPVLNATATQLSVHVPCVESGDATIRVTSNGVPGTAVSRLVVVPQRTLGVGESIVLTSNVASVCNELVSLSASARYLVTVFSASTTAGSQVDVEITGKTPPVGTAPIRLDAIRPFAARERDLPTEESARDAVHAAFLERDRLQFEELRARTPRRALTLPATRAAELPAVGDMRSLYFTFSGGCSDTTRVMRGKAIHIGTRAIIWEDSTNTLQSMNDATLAGFYQRLGQIFDQDQYESVKNNFGDPLLRDALTDNDGRVHMVFSQRLNGSGAAAYVTSCDQFPNTTSRGSNFGQFFYGSVPTTSTLNLNTTASPDGWFYFMARTVVHEVKHISSISARVANSANFEQSWLEEGTARHAEELWVRESLHKVPWKGNTGFGTAASNGILCDFSPSDLTCNSADPLRRPSYGMRRQFNEIREKLLEPWNWSPYGDGAGQSSSTFYQTAWSLVRYTIDRYASSDAEFFRTLVNSRSNGPTNLAAAAGVPMDQLIGGWGLALFADDYPGLASPNADIQFPTWNLRSIYSGLNALPAWSSRWNTVFPMQPPQFAFGSFVSRVNGLRGGAHAYIELSGTPNGPQLVGLRSVVGAAVPTNLRIAIARLQ